MWLLLTLLATTPLDDAQAREEGGDDVGAIAVLQAAVTSDPRWAMGRVELGRLQLKAGASETALEHLDIARSLAPGNPRAHYLFALAAGEAGRRNESRRALEVALALREGYADAQVRLASLLSAEGDHRGAANALKPYVATHPEANGARLQLAEALERSGDARGAEKELRALLQVAGLKVLAGRRLLALLDAQGRTAEAEKVRHAIDPPRRQLRDLKPSRK
ncbi:MAG: tetratricopeptide repeat protein [Archangium sp.]|nr:tetratricopeptide repeat protein [Archangium sp.]